jgi:phosphoserine phosphatase RsbU/P
MSRRSRIGRLSIRLLLIITVASILRQSHILRTLDLVIIIIAASILVPLLPILLYRWFFRRVLWKVRNRLIATYLLMGLAPLVLFASLGGIASYLLAGQFATNTALSALDDAAASVRDESVSQALASLNQVSATAPDQSSRKPASNAAKQSLTVLAAKAEQPDVLAASQLSVSVQNGSGWRPLLAPGAKATTAAVLPLGNAAPALQLPFRGVVSYQGHLYLCSETSVPAGNHSALVVGSIPLDANKLSELAKGLGTIRIGDFNRGRKHSKDTDKHTDKDTDKDIEKDVDTDADKDVPPPPPPAPIHLAIHPPNAPNEPPVDEGFSAVEGGKVPAATHFFDVPVFFGAPLTVTSWATGNSASVSLTVRSRPSLLYAKLFSTSFIAGKIVRVALLLIATFFALLEVFALLMAMGLARTITRSVADLYRGTKEIDAGHLDHRIRVARHDQLGALASSFNGMAASISDLLIQQSEKERLLNELKIAQEVQTTLFPDSPASLGGFEMHAMSLPARTVGGDYFDFIFGPGNNLCLALGDISGKGISAALLMASLNSAVRAFILGHDAAESSAPSPANLLTLLNRHLYISTQSARYATLFLAAYDVENRRLTYSNGGHLAPLVLSTDGTVKRLDVGGSVVGLLEDLEYVEATVQLEPGDLLVAFTDGLTEPENASGEFGEARLLDYIARGRQLPLPLLAASTLKVLQDWIGDGEQPDDMTILLARQL